MGAARRSISTSTDSTLGRGRKTAAGTRPISAAVAKYATRTETAPKPVSPGAATSRSPASRCTITTMRPRAGTSRRRSSTSGVATL